MCSLNLFGCYRSHELKTTENTVTNSYRMSMSTFDKNLEFFMADLLLVQINLQSEQQGEEELVFFIQATCRVPEHFKRQVLDDVLDSFGRDRRFLGTRH